MEEKKLKSEETDKTAGIEEEAEIEAALKSIKEKKDKKMEKMINDGAKIAAD